jgi:thioredoxin-related protein
MTQQDFSRQMRVSGTPTFFFIDKEGSVLGAQPGFIPKDTYELLLTYVGTDVQNEINFKEYLNQN